MSRAAAVLLALAAFAAAFSGLREGSSTNCGVAHYGRPTGTAQRLVQTRLGAGLADWTVRVPIPPSCRDAAITGVQMTVCDVDAPPNVSMSDALTARVHRTGQLSGSAAVNVTVHCVPPDAADATTPTPSHHADTRSTDEILSKEQDSNEHISTETVSFDSEPSDVKSNEWISTVAMTTSTTSTPELPSTQRLTTSSTVAPTTGQVIPTLNKLTHSKEKSPHALKVTIKITPGSDASINEEQPQTYNIVLPSSYREPPAVKSRQTLPLARPRKHRARSERVAGGAGGAHYVPDALYGALMPRYMVGPLLPPLGMLRPQPLWPRRRPLLYLPHF